jgi:hypothetical protein
MIAACLFGGLACLIIIFVGVSYITERFILRYLDKMYEGDK